MSFREVLPVWWGFYWRLVVASFVIQFVLGIVVGFGSGVVGAIVPEYVDILVAVIIYMVVSFWAVCSVFNLDIDEALPVWWMVYWRLALIAAVLTAPIAFTTVYLALHGWAPFEAANTLSPFALGDMIGWALSIFSSYWGVHAALKRLEPEQAEIRIDPV